MLLKYITYIFVILYNINKHELSSKSTAFCYFENIKSFVKSKKIVDIIIMHIVFHCIRIVTNGYLLSYTYIMYLYKFISYKVRS